MANMMYLKRKHKGVAEQYAERIRKQGSEPVQGTVTKTGNERNFDRNKTKFYSSEQNKKIEMAINQLIMLFYRSI